MNQDQVRAWRMAFQWAKEGYKVKLERSADGVWHVIALK